jgi:hypothetical protein
MNKTLVIAILALVIATSSFFFPRTVERVVETLGASGSGQDTTSPQSFMAGLSVGGMFATSTAGNMTLPGNSMDDESTIIILPTAATTVTLPASTTLANVIPRQGMSKTYTLFNRGTSTVAITLAGSTGVTLVKSSTTVIAQGSSTGTNGMFVTLTRLFNNNISAQVENFGQ